MNSRGRTSRSRWSSARTARPRGGWYSCMTSSTTMPADAAGSFAFVAGCFVVAASDIVALILHACRRLLHEREVDIGRHVDGRRYHGGLFEHLDIVLQPRNVGQRLRVIVVVVGGVDPLGIFGDRDLAGVGQLRDGIHARPGVEHPSAPADVVLE